MEIQVLDQTPLKLKLLVKDIPLHVLNSIRRTTMTDVPTMAIDYVVFTINTSVFYDEYIAHRLGLIPLTSKEALGKYKPPEECREAGEKGVFSEDCYVKFELEAVGEPGRIKIIYSGDLKTSDPDVKPVYDNIPIVALTGRVSKILETEHEFKQEIKLEAYARLGRGREHSKWSPVSIASHKYVPVINIDESKCKGSGCIKCIDICPKNVFELKDDKIVVNHSRIYDCTLCRQCELQCPYEAISVGWIDGSYILTIETTGALPPKTVLLEAVNILIDKIDKLEKFVEQGSGLK